MKNKIKGLSLLIAALLLVTITTPIFAQSETNPAVEPAPETDASSFTEHPVVKLLASFFANLFTPPAVEEPDDELPDGQVIPPTEPEGEPVPGDEALDEVVDPLPDALPVVTPEEALAVMHVEQDLGFGEMTKLMQMAAEAQTACSQEGVNCEVTLDMLVEEYKAGDGMGAMFKEYGKPEMTGVGQVRKAAEPKEKSNKGKAKGKK